VKLIGQQRKRMAAALAAVACVISAVGCTSSGRASSGQVAVVAQSGTETNYIFPFYGPQDETLQNVQEFQQLMYRPLYAFGVGSEPILNTSLSLADPPQWSSNNLTATVRLKSYRWSNGTSLTPQNVAFWLGLDRTEKQNWAYYAPGSIPDDLKSVAYDNAADTVTFSLNKKVNPTEFTDAELGQIVPLPLAWDITAAGRRGNCASEEVAQELSSCPAVYNYLTEQAKNQATYLSSPLWRVVDGPFKLATYAPGIEYSFTPNATYSGSGKSKLSQLKFVYYTSDAAEYNALRSGSLDVGYIPPQDLPAKNPSAAVGQSPVSGYTLSPQNFLGFYEVLINFNNPSVGPIFRQLYFRQAFQHLVNQSIDILKANQGYGFPQYGPIPTQPANPFISKSATINPYPFSITAARQLLESHGWSVPTSDTAFCHDPGTGPNQCGIGIPAGKKLVFKLEETAGQTSTSEAMQELASDASAAGITINIVNETGNQVVGDAVACQPSQATCGWQLINDGSQGYASPFPSGEEYFATGASQNVGSYSNPTMDQLISATLTSPNPSAMFDYENYAEQQVPVLWQPFYPFTVTAISDKLHGALPLSILQTITPENWYFS
jgi:peptide/nickel transport system substrate-binding protein